LVNFAKGQNKYIHARIVFIRNPRLWQILANTV
jgi:hypothetical protein